MKISQVMPNTCFINEYGPTEATVGCSYQKFTSATVEQYQDRADIHIGKPIKNTQFYVLNEQLSLLHHGVAGELFVGGDGLARGYLNRPDLTEERFIDNPFYQAGKANSSKRLYKTGDLVRYIPSSSALPSCGALPSNADDNGNLEFIGRADDQVKIRGFRIELGEVEAQLSQLDTVDSALVMAKDIAGSTQLVGYVKPQQCVAQNELSDYVNAVKTTLAQQLPEYMVPGFIVVVEGWPLTPNGKIDRRALPEPDSLALQGEYVAPDTETEQLLVEIWADLLNIEAESISTTADFFDLGGHSLLSIRLVSAIRSRCEVELSVVSIFDHSMLQALAVVIEQGSQASIRPPLLAVGRALEGNVEGNRNKVPVSFAQQRLWFIDSLQGGSSQYNMPMVFEVTGQLDIGLLSCVFNTIIERHEILRTVYLDEQGQTLQHIRTMADINFEIKIQDLSHLAIEAQNLESQVKTLVGADITKAFDLTADLMLRVGYVKKTADTGVLIFNMHHIASDGWSMDVLIKEFFALYEAYSQGRDNPLAPLAIQYADYAQWQRDYLVGEVLESQL
ncbi:MAG: condensation domain-containing protein, partial [Psychrosphaera sp.]|nr:condensation domain-containing protein [Psychrosphaera sp.]